ncbi:MAG: CoA transferase [Anaerolineales bacterium]|uniref:CoA transferase n=1 Tax=Candidatus Desulfolinea nitratireducens TaxID=2841698 RepID=A0A8J6NM32_9CHLR|nr:CoA transferase [Candidatus Desulfolinea nitratireducens]MBL6960081.1 CoA transferase [Anaerolineales bacterium]
MTFDAGMGASLRGLRVLDLTRNLAGPYCTMILGDMGADVIKVERPGYGDDTRSWSPPTWHGESTTFLSANRNKRSMAIDINAPEGVKIVQKLALQADILVESFRPGSLEKRGLGYEGLKEKNPGLIYCSISAYGNTGPLRNSPGYDPILQASTGIMDMTGEPDQPPVRLPIAVNDLGSGMWAVMGILSAVIRRQISGQGCLVETSLFETASWWMNYHITSNLATGETPVRCGTGTPWLAPYEVYPASDEGLLVCAGNDNLFQRFVEELEIPELAADERFATNPMRVKNRAELRRLIIDRFQTRTAVKWEEALRARSIPCSRIHSVADLVQEEQLQALGLLKAFPHPLIPELRLIDSPVSIDGTRASQEIPPPLLGEHTDAILAELGYEKKEVETLREKKVIA